MPSQPNRIIVVAGAPSLVVATPTPSPNNFNPNGVAIIGGTIDGTVIGGATPAAATFTTLSCPAISFSGGNIDGVALGEINPITYFTMTVGNVVINATNSNNGEWQIINNQGTSQKTQLYAAGISLNGGCPDYARWTQKSNNETVYSLNVDPLNSDAIDNTSDDAFKFGMQGTEGYRGLAFQAQPAGTGTWSGAPTVWSVDYQGNMVVMTSLTVASSLVCTTSYQEGQLWYTDNSIFVLASNTLFGFTPYTNNPNAQPDTILIREAANTLTMRNGVTAQIFNIDGIYSDSGNYTILSNGSYDGTNHYIMVMGSGSYVNKNLNIGTNESGNLNLVTDNTVRWIVTSQGNLWSQQDNVVEIGDSGGGRPAYIYVGTSIVVASTITINSSGLNMVDATISSPMLTATSLTTNTNNWNPGLARNIRVIASVGPINITGMVAGTDGQETLIWNVGSYAITFTHNDSSSTAGNRFLNSSNENVIVSSNGNINVIYDATSAFWRTH